MDDAKKPAAPKRGPGRPRVEQRSGSAVMVWVPVGYHDRLIKTANARGQSVSALVRQLLPRRL
jgi:hypothetical protein